MTTHLLERVSQTPGTALQIHVDAEQPQNGEAGLAQGGTFQVEPGDKIAVSDYVARIIMGDAGLAPHFKCTPPIEAEKPAPKAKATAKPATGDSAT